MILFVIAPLFELTKNQLFYSGPAHLSSLTYFVDTSVFCRLFRQQSFTETCNVYIRTLSITCNENLTEEAKPFLSRGHSYCFYHCTCKTVWHRLLADRLTSETIISYHCACKLCCFDVSDFWQDTGAWLSKKHAVQSVTELIYCSRLSKLFENICLQNCKLQNFVFYKGWRHWNFFNKMIVSGGLVSNIHICFSPCSNRFSQQSAVQFRRKV